MKNQNMDFVIGSSKKMSSKRKNINSDIFGEKGDLLQKIKRPAGLTIN